MIKLTDAIRIYKNEEMFKNVIMVEISPKAVLKTTEQNGVLMLYNQDELVGLNIFDKNLFSDYQDGFIYPEIEVLQQLNDFLKMKDIQVNFQYDKNEYLKVAQVLEVNKVEGSDNLTLCKVLVADQNYSMICGAKNVRVGMKTIAAIDNALLPDGVRISSGEVLGVYSDGMLCSLKELGLDNDKVKPGIVDLSDDEIVGTSFFNVDWRKYNV